MKSVEQFLQALQRHGFHYRQQGHGWRAQCPCHQGGDRNLVIDESPEGKLLLSCKSHHCTYPDILAAVGIRPEEPHQAKRNGVHLEAPDAEYPYRDESGRLLYTVGRFPGKQFKSYRLDARQQKIWQLGDTRRVLFGLPELLRSEPGELIALVEGEKDAMNVAARGVKATCNPHGAGSWRPEYTGWLQQYLPDRRFVIVEDYDPLGKDNKRPGEEHARQVFASLTAAGLTAHRVLLPGLAEGQDVSDWIVGRTEAELKAALQPPPPELFRRFLSFAELLAKPPPEWQIEGLFYESSLVEIYGPQWQGKSLFMLDVSLAMRRGGRWCGRQIHKPGPVVYVNADGGLGFQERAKAWVEIHGFLETDFEFWTFPEPLLLRVPAMMREFRAALAWLPQRPAMVILDTLSRCLPGVDENASEHGSLVVHELNLIQREFGTTCGLVHHSGRSGEGPRGTSSIDYAMDTILHVTQPTKGMIEVAMEKQREGQAEQRMAFLIEQDSNGRPYLIETESETETSEEEVLECIRVDPGVSARELETLTGLSKTTLWRYLNRMKKSGLIVEQTRLRRSVDPAGGRPPKGLFVVE